MPRQARLILPGIAVHLVQRGNDRAACFRERGDYFVYLLHLRELAKTLGCHIHAYCLMTNHVHLLVTPPIAEACASLMRNLGQRYVQYFNRHHRRSGTLWEGRYRSCIAESARYVLACYRYIELNPVRAGMAAAPGDYPWSSHEENSGGKLARLTTPHPEFLALGTSDEARRAAYVRLFDADGAGDLEAIRRATNGGYPLVSDELKSSLGVERRRLEPRKPGPTRT